MSFLSGVGAALGLSREKSALSNGQMYKHFKATYAAVTCDVSVDESEQVCRRRLRLCCCGGGGGGGDADVRVAGMAVSQRWAERQGRGGVLGPCMQHQRPLLQAAVCPLPQGLPRHSDAAPPLRHHGCPVPLLRALPQRRLPAARAPRRLQPRRLHRCPLCFLLSIARGELGHVQRVREHAGIRGDHAVADNRWRCLQRDAVVRSARVHHAVAGPGHAAA